VETIEQQSSGYVRGTPRRNFLAINPFAIKSFTRTAYTGARARARGNAIKLSAKTIIYPDPAVPRNEGK